jgi:ABC-type phosphate transport system substrate-binding protein
MRSYTKVLFLILLSCFAFAPGGRFTMAQNGGSDFVIIVNASVPGTQITEATLKGIYLRDMTRWGPNQDIILVDLEGDDDVRTAFHARLFSKTAGQMKTYWINLRLSKRIPMPVTEPNSASAKKFVSQTAGAIAYIRPSEVDSSVKVLRLIKER